MLKEREKNPNGTATNNTTVAPSSSSTTVSSSSAALSNDTNLNSNDNNNSGNSQINNSDKDICNLSPNSQSSSSSVTANNNNGSSVAQLQSNDDQLGSTLSTKDSTNKCDTDASSSDKNVPINIKKEGAGNSGGGNELNVDLMHADNPNGEDASNNNNGINRVIIKTEEQIDTSSDGFSTNPGGNGSNQEQHLANNGNSNNNNVNNLGHNVQQANVINQKQTNGMEYMQQQSQIFVFSTALANKGAESVMNGQFPSIIAYHCSQPATKKFLEKHPLKITQFNRQNQTTQWLNNVTMAKNNKNQNVRLGPNLSNNNGIQNHPNIPSGGGVLGQNPGSDKRHINIPSHGGCIPSTQDGNGNIGNGINSSVSNESNSDELPWDPDGENLHLDAITNEMPQNSSGRPNSNNGNNANSTNMSGDLDIDNLVPEGNNNRSGRNSSTTNTSHPSPNYQQSRIMGAISPISGLQPSLQGVKVPDEVLTPQQRQHREESLARIRKMQQMFFPEQGQHGQNPNLPQNQMMANSGILQQQQNALMNQSLGGQNQIKSGAHMGPGPQNRCILPMSQDLNPNQSNEGMNELNYRVMHPLNSSQQPIDILAHHGSIMRSGNRKNCLEDVNVQMQQMLNQINTCSPVNQNKSQQQQQQQHMLTNSLVGGHGGNNFNMHVNSGNNFVSAQIEWNKLQHQFYENKGKMMADMPPGGPANFSAQNHMINQNRQIPLPIRTNSQGPRSQGPPPPYHQTPRSASVPIATQSPNPSSPNNPTSNLSLPSPRATGGSGSTLSSPADLSRQQQSFKHLTTGQSPTSQDSPLPHRSHTHSNPSTPLSSHMSPNASLKDFDVVNSQNNNMVKEANLMPVPSPQQIQYLNTFDGQELTIQKQPNTNVKDSQCTSNGGPSNTSLSQQNAPPERISGASTPHATNDNRFSSTPAGQNANQPNSITNNGNSTFPVPSSPQTPTPMNPAATSNMSLDDKNNRINQTSPAAASTTGSQNSHQTIRQNSNTSQHNPNSNSNPSGNSAVSPGINFSIAQSTAASVQTQTNVTSQAGPQTGPTGGIKMGNFMDISPNGAGGGGGGNPNKCGNPNQKPPTEQNPTGGGGGFNSCGRTDNLPLNPNSGMVGSGPKTSHFDPISSLAQMSQQLTSNSINGQTTSGGGAVGVMNYGGHSVMNNDFGGGMIPGPHSHDGGGMMTGIDCAIGGLIPGHYGGSNQMISQGPGGSMILPGGPRSVSPKLGFSGGGGVPRLLGRSQMSGPFNGANIQVKASAPNTIQYLPTRPQISGNQQSRPPSLEFLHRFTNPINNPTDVKLTNTGLQFYANCNQMNIPPGHHMENDSNVLGDHPGIPGLGMGGGNNNLPPHLMGQNIMMRGMRPHNPNQMMRMSGPPSHIISNHFSNSNNNGNVPEQIFSSGGPPNAQMFVAGSKNSPIINNSHGDNSQQIPSTMSGPNNNNAPVNGSGNGNNGSVNTTANQSNNPHGGVCPGGSGSMGGHNIPGGPSQQNPNSFKPQFIGPSTADPNYAQQFHNFQQQLYATNTRSQLNQQHQHQQQGGLNPIQSFFVPK